jgi:hypothetical protein
MGVRDFGAVCDASVLVDRTNFERAQQLFEGGELYLPSATYSWLARDKLISVRGKAIGYSLVSQFVRDQSLFVVYLPELYDELSRRLLFSVDRRLPLTDLRATMLATHMRLPLLAFDNELVERLEENFDGRVVQQLDLHADWSSIEEALDLYRRFSEVIGGYLCERLNEDDSFDSAIVELESHLEDYSKSGTESGKKVVQTKPDPGMLNFKYLIWDLTPVVCEYSRQHVLQPEIVREVCERALLLLATPADGGH